MYVFITVLIMIICVILMLVILVQNPKGGGLGAGFGGGSSNIMGGVKQTTDFLEKATWTMVVLLFFLSIFANAFIPRDSGEGQDTGTKIENILDSEE